MDTQIYKIPFPAYNSFRWVSLTFDQEILINSEVQSGSRCGDSEVKHIPITRRGIG